MSPFDVVRENVTARQVAEYYGLKVNRNGMACCPFHEDRHPSMKLDERFHCFGCGADGDAIDLTAKLFNLTLVEAAKKLIADFGAEVCEPDSPAPPVQPNPAKRCHDVLLEMEIRLWRQKRETAPQSMADPITTEYAQNCQMYDFIVYLADLLSKGTERAKEEAISYLTGGVLDRFEAVLQKEVIKYGDIF